MKKWAVWLLAAAMMAGCAPAWAAAEEAEAAPAAAAELQAAEELEEAETAEPEADDEAPADAEETPAAGEEAVSDPQGTETAEPGAEKAEETGAKAETGSNDPTQASSVTPPKTFRLLQNGSKGEDVTKLQQRLIELGYYTGAADGIYGRETRAAVRAFQKRNGLSVDGAAGKQTQTKLYSADALRTEAAPELTDTLAGEWPMLVNKEHLVGENFRPADLVVMKDVCDASLIRIKYASTQAVRPAVEALKTMLEAAREDGITKWQCSAAYRSWADQDRMLSNKIKSYQNRNSGWSRARARRAALKTVAEPGASEHHLGLSFDINVPGTSAFAGTKQQVWLHEHCWEYGFIIRYQEGKEEITGFEPEAWHIRYVGSAHAKIMRDENLCLEEYLQKYAPQTVTGAEQDGETVKTEEPAGEAAAENGQSETPQAASGEDAPPSAQENAADGTFEEGFFDPGASENGQGLIEELMDGEYDEEAEG